MNKKRNLTMAVVISTVAGILALQNVSAPSLPDAMVETPTPTSTSTKTSTPTPTYEGCGYMWAYHDDLELSAKITESVEAINPSASARAQLFGEDCVYADGHSTFSVMETDFYVQLPTDDLTAEEEFGNWIKQSMDLIVALPQTDVAGRKGFVEFSFIHSESEQIIVRVTIDEYLNNSPGVSGTELFRKFYIPTPTPAPPVQITPTPTP
jgi:hypothetical protein